MGTPLEEYVHTENAFGDEEHVDKVFGIGTWRKTINFCQDFTKRDPLANLFFFHILDWNVPDGITPEIRLGFHYGLIVIFPFLDYELMQKSLRLPTHLRYHYSTKKASLKLYCMN